MSLLALQREFHRFLIDEPGRIDGWIDHPASGLAVYHNAYRAQLIDCLAETYARTHSWLGGEAFLAAMRHHIERTPPRDWTLGTYGDGFTRTLASLYPDDPEVAELALLEWRLSRAFESGDADALPPTAISGIDWDEAQLAFVPSVNMMPVLTNAGAIWSALVTGDVPPAAALLPEPSVMLVWRQEFTPCFRTIDMIEQAAIERAMAGVGFADLCQTMVETYGEGVGLALAGQMLGRWFSDELILQVITKEMSCA